MTLVRTESITTQTVQTASEGLQTYCGLDCMVTLEVREELARLFSQSPAIYAFERALQGPYLEIMQRGFAVDELARRHAASELHTRLAHLDTILQRFARASWGKGLNPRSPAQLKDFLYGALKLPEVWISQKGVRKLSTNREALEKLDVYMLARPIITCILAIRDIGKQLDVLETNIDQDGRFRASYNIAGTETGRPSSSTNAFGTGGNAQNIAPALRYVFVADPGCKIAVIDLEQVEARDVGFFCGVLLGDWSYLDACESGDLHTNNARRIWPEMAWIGDPGRDRVLADRNFYRDFTYRDMAKRGSHLSNYMGTAWTAGRVLKVPINIMEDFQARYIKGRVGTPSTPDIQPAFPCIPRWWQWVAQQLQTTQQLVTPFGRRRHFFGRSSDDTTLREAIAYLPQSTTADRMNLGMWRVWHGMPDIQLLAQTYDSITFQAPDDSQFDARVGRALELIRVELTAAGRSYVVPGEAKVGWNWASAVTHDDVARALAQGKKPPRLNPDGLVKWKPGQDRRVRQTGLKRLMP